MPPLPDADRENAGRRTRYLVLPPLPTRELVAYATSMSTVMVAAECSQCGRKAPLAAAELLSWRHGELAVEGEVGEGLLVCPDCDAEHREYEFEEGEGG